MGIRCPRKKGRSPGHLILGDELGTECQPCLSVKCKPGTLEPTTSTLLSPWQLRHFRKVRSGFALVSLPSSLLCPVAYLQCERFKVGCSPQLLGPIMAAQLTGKDSGCQLRPNWKGTVLFCLYSCPPFPQNTHSISEQSHLCSWESLTSSYPLFPSFVLLLHCPCPWPCQALM